MNRFSALSLMLVASASSHAYESQTVFVLRCDTTLAQLTVVESSFLDTKLFGNTDGMKGDMIVDPSTLTKTVEIKDEMYREPAGAERYECRLASARYRVDIAPHIFNSRTSGRCGAASPSISVTISRDGRRLVQNLPFQRDCHDQNVIDALRIDERARSVTLYSGLRVLQRHLERKFSLNALPQNWHSALFQQWPSGNPDLDLLQGVRRHDFALVTRALDSGADVNFHAPDEVGVLGALGDGRPEAWRLNRVTEFDEETDRLLALLLARGASPTLAMRNGNTAVDFLANKVPNRTVRTLLDAGWPDDYQYRLYVGAVLGDPTLVQDALAHGADPNKLIRDSRHLGAAISRASSLSDRGSEAEREQALAALELLLKAGAKIDEGTPRSGGGDLATVYAYSGHKENIREALDLLVRYATPAARRNTLYWLRVLPARPGSQRQANLDWLIRRLDQ